LPVTGCCAPGICGGGVEVEEPLAHEPLHEVVEQLGELGLGLLVAVAAQRLEHLGGELAAVEEGVEDRLLERVHRPVGVLAGVAPVGVRVLAAGEPALEQEVGELVEQRLEVDGVGHLGAELRVRMEAHLTPLGEAGRSRARRARRR
jgi:hypothetical protein